MKDLINVVSFYVFSKIYDQYEKIKFAKKNFVKQKLKTCDNIFSKTMSFSCAHMIKIVMKIEEKKLLFENVHFH